MSGHSGQLAAYSTGYEAIGSELVEQAPTRLQTVVIPIGNGTLAAGVGRAVGRLAPRALRVGVVAKEMPVMADSFDAGKPVAPRGGTTIADGLAVRVAIPLAVERLRGTRWTCAARLRTCARRSSGALRRQWPPDRAIGRSDDRGPRRA